MSRIEAGVPPVLLAIDIGNTNIVMGVFAREALVAQWRIATSVSRMPDEYSVLFESLFRMASLEPGNVEGVVIASVVPAVQTAIRTAVCDRWRLDPLIISPAVDLGISVRYAPPEAVGADRVANAVAAIDRYGVPTIVVDFGTATTFDAISLDEAYVGGAIAPGLEMSAEALSARTAQLPQIALEAPVHAVGESTITSLQSGVLYGYAGLVDGLVERFRSEIGPSAHVIGTGGLAVVIAPLTRTIQHVDPELTLIGLHLLYKRNRPDARRPGVRED